MQFVLILSHFEGKDSIFVLLLAPLQGCATARFGCAVIGNDFMPIRGNKIFHFEVPVRLKSDAPTPKIFTCMT